MQERFRDRDDIADRMVPLRLGLAMERAALDFWLQLEPNGADATPPRATAARRRVGRVTLDTPGTQSYVPTV